jgi:hypothetical protein
MCRLPRPPLRTHDDFGFGLGRPNTSLAKRPTRTAGKNLMVRPKSQLWIRHGMRRGACMIQCTGTGPYPKYINTPILPGAARAAIIPCHTYVPRRSECSSPTRSSTSPKAGALLVSLRTSQRRGKRLAEPLIDPPPSSYCEFGVQLPLHLQELISRPEIDIFAVG